MSKTFRKWIQSTTLCVVSYLAMSAGFGAAAHAGEDLPHLKMLNAELLQQMDDARQSNYVASRLKLQLQIDEDEERLSFLRPGVTSFVIDCTELEAIPLVELSKEKPNRIFFGISFDGVLGFHGRLF